MNKQSFADIEARRRLLMTRLARTVNELNSLEHKVRAMRKGRIKVPMGVRKGTRVKIKSNPNGLCADDFGDLIPSFGE